MKNTNENIIDGTAKLSSEANVRHGNTQICDTCKYHECFYDEVAFDGCLCHNGEAKKNDCHHEYCENATWGFIDLENKKCPYYESA